MYTIRKGFCVKHHFQLAFLKCSSIQLLLFVELIKEVSQAFKYEFELISLRMLELFNFISLNFQIEGNVLLRQFSVCVEFYVREMFLKPIFDFSFYLINIFHVQSPPSIWYKLLLISYTCIILYLVICSIVLQLFDVIKSIFLLEYSFEKFQNT